MWSVWSVCGVCGVCGMGGVGGVWVVGGWCVRETGVASVSPLDAANLTQCGVCGMGGVGGVWVVCGWCVGGVYGRLVWLVCHP